MKSLKKLLLLTLIIIIIISFFYLVGLALPSPKMNHSNEITIYGNKDSAIQQIHYENEGKYLTIDEINKDFIYAFIASEDDNFNNHFGFSLKGISRAMINNILTSTNSGGSTITQQLARSLYYDNDKTILRKIKEAFMTIRIETHYSKDEIIEEYLNNIFLGHNVYGIEEASNYYFSKSNKDLTLNEVCLIVGIANAPNLNAPDINYENAIKRKNYVLKKLYKIDYIDKVTYNNLLNKNPIIKINKKSFKNPITPFNFYIKNFLEKYKFNTKKILANGIKVYTTVDYDLQTKLINLIKKENPNDNSQISAIIFKVNSGDVLAMSGGYDVDDEYLRCLYSIRPVGSTIKPLLYYLALKCKMNPLTYLNCKQTTFNILGYEPFSPTNASNNYASHEINMIQAVGLSDNIYATKALLYVGFDNFYKLINKFDIKGDVVPSSALGINETSLINLTSIYNCFASLGTYYAPRIIKKITDYKGNVLFLNNTKVSKKLETPYVYLLNQLLRAPFDKNLIDYTKPTLINYQTKNYYAAKTGTDSYNSYIIGFNPKYCVGIWNGTDDNTQLVYKNIGKSIFKNFVNALDDENIWYNPPSYINKMLINPITGEYNSNVSSEYWSFNDFIL